MTTYPKTHLKGAITLAAFLAVIITTLPAKESAKTARVPVSLSIDPQLVSTSLPLQNEDPATEIEAIPWTRVKIRPGDNLSIIFKRMGLRAADLQAIVDIGADVSVLRKIITGKTLGLKISSEKQLLALRYEKNALESLLVARAGNTFIAYRDISQPEVITAFQTARISTDSPSLYHAGKKAGLSDNIIMELSYIFQWDISFALDLRKGDVFAVIYEEIYVDGEKVKEGDILAAYFQNMGKTYSAVLFEDDNGLKNYYTPEGRSLRKAFIRDPVHFSHVSSNFNLRRFHPIHKRVMPHLGIDYAANRGTPVVAAGDGKVTIARQNNASGKYVVIQHGQQYTTKYLHLSSFAKTVRPGKNVAQGQTIGFVGATGWATAPHLHFEFLVNGVHRNPKTVKLPKAKPILASNMNRFRASTAPMLLRLSSIVGSTTFANASQKTSRSDG
ncbi:MAG: peptidoglycan DD-metalloendopeptidase family protein [Gammaproteobacteria bacterium]|nr:peptidoglycan DD-metalloendopeptidase family protein [Gammaproteobacteria bacterium]